jgi:hypothetical protein
MRSQIILVKYLDQTHIMSAFINVLKLSSKGEPMDNYQYTKIIKSFSIIVKNSFYFTLA